MDTKALRQKILDLAIRGKLVPQDPNDEPASVLLERIREEKKQMVKDGKLKPKDIKNDTIIFKGEDNLHYEKFQDGTVKCIEDEIPFDIPNTWAWCRIRDICNMSAGKSKSADKISDAPFENSYPCFGGNGIRGYVDEYSNDGTYSIVGRQGALCGNVNIASGKFYATEHAVVTYLYSMIDFKWSNYCLEGLNLNRFATGAAQPGLSVANVLNVLLPLPPFNEQRNIGRVVDNVLTISNSLGTEKDNLLEIITKTKSKILDLAIRGKLVPQNETDEPASVLLERIRAEKEELIKQGKLKRDKKESIIYKGDDNSYYEKFKDGTINCIDEIIPFEIPSSWCFIRLKEVFELLSGRDLSPSDYNDDNNGIPYITGASNFNNGKVIINRWTTTPQVITDTGDLLVTCKGTVGELSVNTVGQAHIARQVMAVRNPFSLNIYYLQACISYYVDTLKHQSKGLIPGISRDDILQIVLPIPPRAEQDRIVEKQFQLSDSMTAIESNLI